MIVDKAGIGVDLPVDAVEGGEEETVDGRGDGLDARGQAAEVAAYEFDSIARFEVTGHSCVVVRTEDSDGKLEFAHLFGRDDGIRRSRRIV